MTKRASVQRVNATMTCWYYPMQLRSVARARERGPFARPSAEVAKICILPFEVATRVTLARLDMDSTHATAMCLRGFISIMIRTFINIHGMPNQNFRKQRKGVSYNFPRKSPFKFVAGRGRGR